MQISPFIFPPLNIHCFLIVRPKKRRRGINGGNAEYNKHGVVSKGGIQPYLLKYLPLVKDYVYH